MALASTLRVGGMFTEVLKAMDEMVEEIKAEELEDMEQRDWCKEETAKNEQEASRWEYKVEKADAALAKHKVKLEELEATVGKVLEEIISTKKDLKQTQDTRNAEHAAF